MTDPQDPAPADERREGLGWIGPAEQRLLASYRRIGCTEREALLAVAGDLLQRSTEPGVPVDDAVEERVVRRFLEAAGLTLDEVRDALGLRVDEAG